MMMYLSKKVTTEPRLHPYSATRGTKRVHHESAKVSRIHSGVSGNDIWEFGNGNG